jgi:hypothetical protein
MRTWRAPRPTQPGRARHPRPGSAPRAAASAHQARRAAAVPARRAVHRVLRAPPSPASGRRAAGSRHARMRRGGSSCTAARELQGARGLRSLQPPIRAHAARATTHGDAWPVGATTLHQQAHAVMERTCALIVSSVAITASSWPIGMPLPLSLLPWPLLSPPPLLRHAPLKSCSSTPPPLRPPPPLPLPLPLAPPLPRLLLLLPPLLLARACARTAAAGSRARACAAAAGAGAARGPQRRTPLRSGAYRQRRSATAIAAGPRRAPKRVGGRGDQGPQAGRRRRRKEKGSCCGLGGEPSQWEAQRGRAGGGCCRGMAAAAGARAPSGTARRPPGAVPRRCLPPQAGRAAPLRSCR